MIEHAGTSRQWAENLEERVNKLRAGGNYDAAIAEQLGRIAQLLLEIRDQLAAVKAELAHEMKAMPTRKDLSE